MTEKSMVILNQLLDNENLIVINENYEKLKDSDLITLECTICKTQITMTVKELIRPHPQRKNVVCPKCRTYNIFCDQIKNAYTENPYEFITEFNGYTSPITVRCKDCGFEFSVSEARRLLCNTNLPSGTHPCKNCSKLRRDTKNNKTKQEILDRIYDHFGVINYDILDTKEYFSQFTDTFTVRCKLCGHVFKATLTNILGAKNGKHYCSVCNNKYSMLSEMSYNERCEQITDGKIIPLEPYINNRTKIKHHCNVCGYEWFKLPIKSKANSGCPICTNKISQSKAELELLDYIKDLYTGKVITKDRKILDGKEIDIYLPELKLAIEFNGLYWHSDKYKPKSYHIDKTISAKNKGIRMIQIFEDEWMAKKEIVKSKIRNILKLNDETKVFARKCEVVDITVSDKQTFLNTYHIQGVDRACIKKALSYNGKIVAVMTLCKPRISLGSNNTNISDGEYELSRYATAINVVGGFSKLLKHITSEHPEITTIKTFADIRWTDMTNNVYTKNGFVLSNISNPSYWFFKRTSTGINFVREHRFKFNKQNLKIKFPDIYDDSKTEFEIMNSVKDYYRIWDCGNLVYINHIH